MRKILFILLLATFTGSYAQRCVIFEDFEDSIQVQAPDNGFDFRDRQFPVYIPGWQDPPVMGCTVQAINPVMSSTNTESSVHLITLSQPEPYLADMGISNPPMTTFTGNGAIRLNQINENLQVVSMKKDFDFEPSEEPRIFSFAFLLLIKSGPHIGYSDMQEQQGQPSFTLRVSVDNTSVYSECFDWIDPISFFALRNINVSEVNLTSNPLDGTIKYTPEWHQFQFPVPSGATEASMQITVSDCNAFGDWAIVYIDDICITGQEECPQQLTITAPIAVPSNGQPQQAEQWIQASNIINAVAAPGFTAYHAGDYVELQPGFETMDSARFSAYIEGCTENPFQYRIGTSQNDGLADVPVKENQLTVFPNPTTQTLNIRSSYSQFDSLTILSSDGKQLLNLSNFNPENGIDVSHLTKGIYLLVAKTPDGQTQTTKFIKQ